MNHRARLQAMTFRLLIVMFITMGCATSTLPFIATATPYPTYTPYPTFTPLPPTATPVPDRWKVKVISAVKAQTFGEWFFEESLKAEYIIITIEYTYMGQETTEFSPQSVVLLLPEGSTWPGYAVAATEYQAENNIKVTDFFNQGPIITFMRPGQTKIEKFGWGFTASADKKYRLLFPETEPIDITISN